jgi:hypothetical protein
MDYLSLGQVFMQSPKEEDDGGRHDNDRIASTILQM